MTRRNLFTASGGTSRVEIPCARCPSPDGKRFAIHEVLPEVELPHSVLEEFHGRRYAVTFFFAPSSGYFNVSRTHRPGRRRKTRPSPLRQSRLPFGGSR